jgi:hypothetical protein
VSASDIIQHYQDKNLSGPELKAALLRHAKLLDALDPAAAASIRKSRIVSAQSVGGRSGQVETVRVRNRRYNCGGKW